LRVEGARQPAAPARSAPPGAAAPRGPWPRALPARAARRAMRPAGRRRRCVLRTSSHARRPCVRRSTGTTRRARASARTGAAPLQTVQGLGFRHSVVLYRFRVLGFCFVLRSIYTVGNPIKESNSIMQTNNMRGPGRRGGRGPGGPPPGASSAPARGATAAAPTYTYTYT